MSNLSDRVSYLRGLAEGLKVDTQSDQGKLIVQMLEVLGEAAKEIDTLREAFDELNNYVESIDDDLAELEESMDGDDDGDFELEDDDEELDDDQDDEAGQSEVMDFFRFNDKDGDEDEEAEEDQIEEDDDETDTSMYAGCICPECNSMFCVDMTQDTDNQMYVCPHCGQTVVAIPMDNENIPIAKAIDPDEGEEDE